MVARRAALGDAETVIDRAPATDFTSAFSAASARRTTVSIPVASNERVTRADPGIDLPGTGGVFAGD